MNADNTSDSADTGDAGEGRDGGLLSRIAASRSRISTQLYAGIGAATAITFIASMVGWFSFNRVGDAQSVVNERSIPAMSAAFGIAQRAGTLVDAAPALVAAATPEEFHRVADSISAERRAFQNQLDALTGDEASDQKIRQFGNALISNIDAIYDSLAERFDLAERNQLVRDELAILQADLANILVPAIDDQLFYVMTGYREIGTAPKPRSEHLSEAEFSRYRHLARLQADVTIGTQLLESMLNLSDGALLQPLRDRLLATAGGIERSLDALGHGPLRTDMASLFARLRELGIGPRGGFDVRTRELALRDRQASLLADNRDIAAQLIVDVEQLVSAAGDNAAAATNAADAAITTGRALLLVLNVLSITGAVLIAWLFVGRVLLRRIERLSERMQAMADGDLEGEVDIAGRDEVADMAKALEVFRRHALEAQRLNLVEKLADELRGKNERLETAMADLQRMQDQMVAQEKLAALGELTAGVAHEIKNPLNFVKNFSEASQELLEELQETLAEATESLDDEQQGLIKEINQDLTENLARIGQHSERADRIVRDMLTMGRDSGERQETDLNALLSEHTKLAFHAARGNDIEFQLGIVEDLDPNLGTIVAVPQDLGRVFLNMVSNACYATNERRLAEPSGYQASLRIATRRFDDRVEVAIADNGGGMPKDVAEKIFNPFFTTKPTDKGTGLGLALSNDIVRQHGGTIEVETEDGEGTTMTVKLPQPPPRLPGAEESRA